MNYGMSKEIEKLNKKDRLFINNLVKKSNDALVNKDYKVYHKLSSELADAMYRIRINKPIMRKYTFIERIIMYLKGGG